MSVPLKVLKQSGIDFPSLFFLWKGTRNERRESSRWNQKGRIRPHLRRQAAEVGCPRSIVRRLGGLSHEWIRFGSQPALCLAIERLVRADHSALGRRRENLASTRNTRRRADGHAGRNTQSREQQVCVRHQPRDRKTTDDPSVLRWHAASVGVQAGLAFGANPRQSRCGLCRHRRCRDFPFGRRRQKLARIGRSQRS